MAAQNALVAVGKAREWLHKAENVIDVIDLRDKAAAVEYYRRTAHESLESQNEAAEIKVRCERKAGELLRGMKLAKGGRPKKTGNTVLPVSTLAELNIGKMESQRFQAAAAVPEQQFEEYITTSKESGNEITSAEVRRMGQRAKRKEKKSATLNIPGKAATPGDFQLIRGDAVQQLALLESGCATLIFADPPYNIGIDYGQGKRADQKSDVDYLAWVRSWVVQCHRVLADNGSLWLMIGDEYAAEIGVLLKQVGLHRRNWIKWYETFGVNCQNKFNRCSRHIFYVTKSAKAFVFNGAAVTRPSDRQAIYSDHRAAHHGKLWDDVWWIPRLTGTAAERLPDFPTQLPLELMRAIVGCASDPGDLVIDPFSGSGTTGVAALELARRYIGIEEQQQWWQLSKKRLASTTPALAVA